MTVNPEFLALLVCPISQQPLSLCPADVLTDLNGRIVQGTVIDQGGADC